MTAAEWIARARAVTDGATSGPWDVVCHEPADGDYPPERHAIVTEIMGDHITELDAWNRADPEGPLSTILSDAAFIAESRTLLPAAVAAIEAVWEVVDDNTSTTAMQVRAAITAHLDPS